MRNLTNGSEFLIELIHLVKISSIFIVDDENMRVTVGSSVGVDNIYYRSSIEKPSNATFFTSQG